MTQKNSKTTLIGAVAILALLGIALAFWLSTRSDDSDREAFEAGYYERSYEVLEDSWDDSRVDLVRTALYISTCESHNQSQCDILKQERDRFVDRQIPDRLDDGDVSAYQQASSRANDLATTIDAAIEQNDYYVNEIHSSGIDEGLAELIGVTVREAQSSRASLYLADLELIADPENDTIQEAKEQLEAAYAAYETKDLPTDWGTSDVESALTELEDARRVLDEALFID